MNLSILLSLVEETSASITVTRGHLLKLHSVKLRECSTTLRHNFFSYGIGNFWNSLSESVLSAPSHNCFKNRFDKHCITLKFSSTVNLCFEDQSTGLWPTHDWRWW